ncbi:SDR family oxidoreductase [Desulfatiglans anilini]|uniref:SDR family oxidoreductase n=1 Tax=Desulfatiglans anilini TaxID=90728 RepID=UPI000426DD61|nr:SDR family oxidoreductase [Desulfatiglans anilini]
MDDRPVLVTGATGYVGGRLVPLLLEAGHRVRVVGRSAAKLRCRPWAAHPLLEIAEADMLDEAALTTACKGCRAAFYLVHSMNPRSKDFDRTDREAAEHMARAAAAGGVERIIYLGGLGSNHPRASKHLRSRGEVARILQSGKVPATFLRAAVILGAGSASFELIRYLVERLPVMTTPRWVRNPIQPIAISNVLQYLKGCLEHEETRANTYDIGGPDVLTYQRLLETYAEEAGLPRRVIIPVPVLSPRLSSHWLHLVTPVPISLAKPLVEGLSIPVVCEENRIREIIPQRLLSCREAIRHALEQTRSGRGIQTCWSDAGPIRIPEWLDCGDAPYAGGTLFECGYRVVIEGRAEEVWEPITRIGGGTGWYFANTLWALRGAMDRMIGGVGLRRGRRDPQEIRYGDALDFWRVIGLDEGRRLLLLAEMKLPGEATLEFRLQPIGEDRTLLEQYSRFRPKGLFGILYWYAFYPAHQWLYTGMLKGIAKATRRPIAQNPQQFAPRPAKNACALQSKP